MSAIENTLTCYVHQYVGCLLKVPICLPTHSKYISVQTLNFENLLTFPQLALLQFLQKRHDLFVCEAVPQDRRRGHHNLDPQWGAGSRLRGFWRETLH